MSEATWVTWFGSCFPGSLMMRGKKRSGLVRCRFLLFAGALALVLGTITAYHQTDPSSATFHRGGSQRWVNPPWFPKGTLRRKDDLMTRIRPDPLDGRKKIRLKVRGNSMRPELQNGDQIVVYVDSEIRQAKVGQLVTYIMDQDARQEAYYTHKVVEVHDNPWTGRRELVMRGVNNPTNDSIRVTQQNFVGLSRKL